MPLPQQPVVFMEVGFLAALCREMQKPYAEITAPRQNILFLEELIFQRSTVYLDLSEEETICILQGQPLPDRRYDIALGYLQKLAATNRLRSCAQAVASYRAGDYKRVFENSLLPNFLLLADTEETCCKIQNETGVVCISTTFTTEDYTVRFGFEQIAKKKTYDIKDFAAKISQGNCLVIEDPYFAANHCDKPDFMEKLLLTLKGANLKIIPFSILILVQYFPQHKEALKAAERIQKLKSLARKLSGELSGKVRINVESTDQKMHDRHIYSNTYWISCEGGFQEKYNSPTKWNFHPLGLYYSGYHQRLEMISRWLQISPLRHPLLRN